MMGAIRQFAGLILIAALAAVLYLVMTSASRYRLNAAVAESERIAKAESALLGRLDDVAANETAGAVLPQALIWQGEDAAAMEIDVQQHILDAAGKAGLQVMAFGAGAPADGIVQPTIGYDVELEGGHVEVARFLSLLEEARPGLAIGTLWMRQLPPMAGVAKAPISVRLTTWGFRNAEAGSP